MSIGDNKIYAKQLVFVEDPYGKVIPEVRAKGKYIKKAAKILGTWVSRSLRKML